MNNEELFEQGVGQWYVLHTRSRHEKSLAEDLRARRIRYFLPLITKARRWGKRKATVQESLFPGYLFLRGSDEDAYTADRTRWVAQIIAVADQKRLDWELRNIARALGEKAPLDPYPYLKKGIRVEVTSGPLRGLQGLIESRTSFDKLILAVDMLGQGVTVELQGASVEPL
jgi:transcription antitermination factor NusG